MYVSTSPSIHLLPYSTCMFQPLHPDAELGRPSPRAETPSIYLNKYSILYHEKQPCYSLFKIRGRSDFDPVLETLLWPSSGTGGPRDLKFTVSYLSSSHKS